MRRAGQDGAGWRARADEGFAAVHPGLEELLVAELAELGVRATQVEGGATFPATPQALATVLVWSRIAGRVLVRVGSGPARSLEELARGVRSLPWPTLTRPRQPLDVDVAGGSRHLHRRDVIARKVEHAVADALRVPGSWSGPPPRTPLGVLVRLDGDRAEVSVDAGGGLLHRRGWRPRTAKAPLRENLAAALLRGAGWRPGEALVDPMCGSGTIPLEAARQAAGFSPRTGWTYAAASWGKEHARALAAAEGRRPKAVPTAILAADRDVGAIRATEGNARQAGVADRVRVLHASLEDLEPPRGPGLVIANLPYGQRVGTADALAGRYGAWGHVLRERWDGWRLAFLAADPVALQRLDRRAEVVLRFRHGGIRVVLGVVSPG
ncbi:MAG: hypothetical protein H6732_03155 [Alphaproteobacteria bacterium]|nr:hypothetical protein [Alphaproteobacteria bacterium]